MKHFIMSFIYVQTLVIGIQIIAIAVYENNQTWLFVGILLVAMFGIYITDKKGIE